MKKLITILVLCLAFAVQAQTQNVDGQPQKQEPQTPQQALIEHFLKKYTLANRWNDQVTAKDALYDLIAESGSDSLTYNLAVYYYENQQYASSVLISKDLLERAPKNVNLLQIAATCYESLGLKDKALVHYESLYLLTNNTGILYKMAMLQYEIKRYPEAKINVDILLTKPDLDKLKVSVNNAENKGKEYPLKVSVLNMKGLLAAQTGDKILAKKCFEDALAIAPDFPSAKDNLSKLK